MVLIFNAGSSSLKAKLFDQNLNSLDSFEVNRIGESGAKTHSEAAKIILEKLKNRNFKLVGHRIVHGGEKYIKLTEITPEVLKDLEEFSILAPQHNPQALEVIDVVGKQFNNSKTRLGGASPSLGRGEPSRGRIKQYALFDTGFFNDLPLEAKIYPLPYKYYQKEGIRRFGFHGISHQYAAEQAANQLGEDILNTNLITIHLGAGCSIAAISKGKPIDVSMGFTPLEGIMMMTRSGTIDPGIIFYLMEKKKMAPEKIKHMLEFESGILGVSGLSSDMKDIMSLGPRRWGRRALMISKFSSGLTPREGS